MKNLCVLFKTFMYVILFSFFYSCEKESLVKVPEVENNKEYLKSVLASTGIDTSEVVQAEDGYIFEGDILFSYEALEDLKQKVTLKSYKFANPNWYASKSSIVDIAVYVNSNVTDTEWITAIDDALNDWNSISGCHVNFHKVSSLNSSDIHIYMYNQADSAWGRAPAPYNGNVGSYVKLNEYYEDEIYGTKKRNLVAHELGHTLGFYHNQLTDDDGNVYGQVIPGTSSTTDPDAVMYKYGHWWHGFSDDEQLAANIMWPDLSVEVTGQSCLAIGGYSVWTATGANGSDGYTYSWHYIIRRGLQRISGSSTSNVLSVYTYDGDEITFGVTVTSGTETAHDVSDGFLSSCLPM